MSTPKTAPDFGEPWTRSFANAFKINTGELRHFECGWRDRAIACVNACAGMPDPAAEIQALRDKLEQAEAMIGCYKQECSLLREKLDWQNMPNRREPTRGGYEFYINEEWSGLRDAALDSSTGGIASLMKERFDPDDERVRVRRVLDDDAILQDLKNASDAVKEARDILNDLGRYPVERGYVDGPCLKREDMDAVQAALSKLQSLA